MHAGGGLTSPNPPETVDKLSLGVTWASCLFTALIICFRLNWRRKRGDKFMQDDIWMGIALAPILLRLVFIHLSSTNLTTKFNREHWPQEFMSQDEINRRRLGSQMVLPGRTCYAAFIWCMKFCILHWFERITGRSQPYGRWIDITYWTAWVGFLAVVMTTYLECMPTQLYWQIWPDPGKCAVATTQLITMGTLNIATDIMLVLIPLPLVYQSRLPLMRKFQLALLFCVSAFVMAITIIRMPIIIGNETLQKARTLWASIECMAAVLVANAPMFNSMMHKKRVRGSSKESETADMGAGGAGPVSQAERRRRMPVTGQDSIGSLTRNDPLESILERAEFDSGTRNSYLYPAATAADPENRSSITKLSELNNEDDDDEYEAKMKKAIATGQVYRSPWYNGTTAPYVYGGWSSTDASTFPAAPQPARLKNFTFG